MRTTGADFQNLRSLVLLVCKYQGEKESRTSRKYHVLKALDLIYAVVALW